MKFFNNKKNDIINARFDPLEIIIIVKHILILDESNNFIM